VIDFVIPFQTGTGGGSPLSLLARCIALLFVIREKRERANSTFFSSVRMERAQCASRIANIYETPALDCIQ
jgi:hypothetical protein